MRRGRRRSGGGTGAGGEGWVAVAMRNRKPSLWQGVQTAKVEERRGGFVVRRGIYSRRADQCAGRRWMRCTAADLQWRYSVR